MEKCLNRKEKKRAEQRTREGGRENRVSEHTGPGGEVEYYSSAAVAVAVREPR